MNTLQFLAILAYVTVMILFLYFNTNKFEKGWVKNLLSSGKYKNLRGGYIYFRFIAAGVVISLVLLLKWIGVQ